MFKLKTSHILNRVSVHSHTTLGHLFADLHSKILDAGKVKRISAMLKIWLKHNITLGEANVTKSMQMYNLFYKP